MHRRGFIGSLLGAGLLQAEGEGGFQALFDGRTLNGWKVEDGPATAFRPDGEDVVVTEAGNSPTWLRSEKSFENFELRGEFFVKGWIDSGIYLHAPLHGNAQDSGLCIKLFHKKEQPKLEGMGAIFPVVAPKLVNVKDGGTWNAIRVKFDWPSLQVWSNGELIQDIDCEKHPELQWRLREGYLGLQSLGYPIRFRKMEIRELPAKVRWQPLYGAPSDFDANWQVEEGKAKWQPIGSTLRADGLGHLATKERYRDFALQMYVRASKHSNGGVLFRAEGSGRKPHYEIQLHDVEGAVYPTGSLYGFRRAKYLRVPPEEWYLYQMFVKDRRCVVRINGETVTDYDAMENLNAGHILLQAHQEGRWIEYKDVRIRVI